MSEVGTAAGAEPTGHDPLRDAPLGADTDEAVALGASIHRALGYVAAWSGKRAVIKFGGAALAAGRIGTLIEDIVALRQAGIEPVLVHGGGPEISKRLEAAGQEARFKDGLRVTDEGTMAIVEEVLGRVANERLVQAIEAAGGAAEGVNGFADRVLHVTPHPVRELGFVGQVDQVDPARIEAVLAKGRIPVVAPLGCGPEGHAYNVNGDTAAAAIAGALGASKFLLLTDVRGVFRPVHTGPEAQARQALVSELTPAGAASLIEDGTIASGMIPKVGACLRALELGVARTHILSASQSHALLVELFTERGIGTMITDRQT